MVNVPIGVLGIVLTWFLVPDWQPRNSHRFDVPGIVLCCLGLFGLVFGIQNGQQYDWGTVAGPITIPEIIGAGLLLLIAFVFWQARTRGEPLLPLQVFRSRTFSFANLANTALGFTITGMFLPLVIYIQAVRGYTPVQSGLLTAPMSLLSGIIAPFAGRLSDRIPGKYVVMLGLGAMALGLGILALQAEPDTHPYTMIPGLLVCGFGMGCVFSPLSNTAMGALQPRFVGAGAGIFNTSRQVGGVLGSAAIGVLLQAWLSAELNDAAKAQADTLPEPMRAEFVSQLTANAGNAASFGPGSGSFPLPPNLSQAQAGQLRQAAIEAFHVGFTSAAKATLILPVVVLLIGIVFAAGMGKGIQRTGAAPAKPQAEPTRA